MVERAVDMFRWWNEAAASGAGFCPGGFRRFFTEDGELIVNGDRRATGPIALAAHFERVRLSLADVSIRLPLEHAFAAGDDVFVHYRVDAVNAGARVSEAAMGYMRFVGARIALMDVLSVDLP